MTEFRTIVEVRKSSILTEHEQGILLCGSCFAEHIGAKLLRYKFNALVNPAGVLYNPASINNCLSRLIDGREVDKTEFTQSGGVWRHFDFHGSYGDIDLNRAVEKVNQAIKVGNLFLTSLKHLVISWGTVWIYRLKDTGMLVSNCHKKPKKDFDRLSLNLKDVVSETAAILEKLKTISPHLRVILTVSPVRHWKDGPVENMRSKATLISAVRELIAILNYVEYFPAFEIMMDDLRDYRFYAKDMIHPGEMAVDYIWNRFETAYLSDKSREILSEIEKIMRCVEHRALHPGSREDRDFVNSSIRLMRELYEKHEFLDFSQEKTILKERNN